MPADVSLAGEFAVLSQLALRGYNANMTLGHTKEVDILVADPHRNRLYKLEVKTNYQNSRNGPQRSRIFGNILSGWIMHKKHENIVDPKLFYCFVNIDKKTRRFRFYILPNRVVAAYVKAEHQLWLREKKKESKRVQNTEMRIFRIGIAKEKYKIKTPIAERYENNFEFKK